MKQEKDLVLIWIIIILMLAVAVAFTTGCGKRGPTGPTGRQGQQGQQGIQGTGGITWSEVSINPLAASDGEVFIPDLPVMASVKFGYSAVTCYQRQKGTLRAMPLSYFAPKTYGEGLGRVTVGYHIGQGWVRIFWEADPGILIGAFDVVIVIVNK